jgi:hypothetical protein
MFDEIVCLKMEAGWCYIESVEQALDCLRDRFEDQSDASWKRAHANCLKALEGDLGADAVKSTFIVAAMSAGILYELAKNLDVMEIHLEEATNKELIDVLLKGKDRF